MGTGISKEQRKDYKTLENVLDYIATNYILTSDFKTLSKLYEEEYCSNLVILTRDIMEKNFNDMELTFLSQRLKGKDVIDKEITESVVYTTKERLKNADDSSHLRKKRMCESLAKFYVRIGHVFAAIVMTINPVYVYKDAGGNMIKTPMAEKDTIPKGAKDRHILREGMCYNRINQLRHGQDFVNIEDDGDITLSPDICSDSINITDEPGIPELETLYYDKYDYKTGNFDQMKDATKREYLRDVEKFYKVFTGSDTLPDNPIKSFSDIKLSEYNKSNICKHTNPIREKITGSLKDELFQKYALTLRDMVRKSNDVQKQLLEVVNKLFTYHENKDKKRIVRIRPELNEKSLNDIVSKTRHIILNYYLTCEKDFTQGVKLYESIVENQIKDTTKSQIDSLQEIREQMTQT